MRYQRIPPETSAQFIACKDRPEWLKERAKSLGTSDVGAMLGISTFRKPLQVYVEKRIDPATGKPLIPSSEPSEAMTWGLLLEDVVRRHYAAETGRKIWHKEHCLFRHPELPFHCSLDGIAVDQKQDFTSHDKWVHGKRILEVKTVNGFVSMGHPVEGGGVPVKVWGEEGSDDIPLSYVAGVQWSMGILGPDWVLADVAVLFGGNKYRCYTVERDDAIIKKMQWEAGTFWKRITDGRPPEVTDGSTQTRKALEALYQPKEKGEILEAGLVVATAISELDIAKAKFKEAEADKKRLENIICAAIGSELGVTDGKTIYKWTSYPKKGYEVKATTCRTLRRSEKREKKA